LTVTLKLRINLVIKNFLVKQHIRMQIVVIRGNYYKSQGFIQSYRAVHTAQGIKLHFLIKFFSCRHSRARSLHWLICPAQEEWIPAEIHIFLEAFPVPGRNPENTGCTPKN